MANQADFPVRRLCRVLRVSSSGFYAWRGRAPSARAQANAHLGARILEVFERSDATYGAPRVCAQLRNDGLNVGKNRIARLMRAQGLRGVSLRRAFCVTTGRDRRQRPAPDLAQRHFEADGPNRLWVADMTYVPTWTGFVFLIIVLDVWSRRVVGRAIDETMHTDLVLDALAMACAQRRPRDVIHHSDQGSQGGFNRSWRHRDRNYGVATSIDPIEGWISGLT